MNIAYIDGQNLQMATKNAPKSWEIDAYKFRRYLARKYDVGEAHYYVGAYGENHHNLYRVLQMAGFIVEFRMHGIQLASNKKGNVDGDIIFDMMQSLRDRESEFSKALLVSGDGDYLRVVQYFIDNDKFAKILLPSHKNASSLYKRIPNSYCAYLDTERVESAIKRNGGRI